MEKQDQFEHVRRPTGPFVPPAPGHSIYMRLLDEMKELHIKKSSDYGTGQDAFANIRRSARLGVEPWKAVLVRMGDKWQRIESYCQNGKLENESLEDSLMDLASYALICLALRREQVIKIPAAAPVAAQDEWDKFKRSLASKIQTSGLQITIQDTCEDACHAAVP